MSNNNFTPDNTQGDLNIKSFLLKSIKYWYVFVFAIVLSYFLAFYKVRYSVPAYSVNARVLIKDDFSTPGSSLFLPGMELLNTRNRLINEIGIIKSFPIMRKVIEALPDYKVDYNDIGNIKTTELYNDSPFKVTWDTLNNNLYNRTYYLKIISDEKFLLSDSKFENDQGLEYAFDEPFKMNGNILVIKATKHYDQPFNEKLYSFRINNLDDLAFSYLNKVNLYVEAKESSILGVSSWGINVQKTIDFVNALVNVYIQHGVEQVNLTVTNTLNFVDQQLKSISDSLGVSEDNMEAFSAELNNKRIQIYANEGSKGNIIDEILALERQKISTKFSLSYYKYTLGYLEENDDTKGLILPGIIDQSNSSSQSFDVAGSIKRYMELYLNRSKLLFSATDKSQGYAQLTKEIAMAKQVLLQNLKTAIEKIEFDIKQLDEQLAEGEAKLAKIPPANRQFTNIERKHTLSNELYTYLLQKRSEASIAKAANISKVQVLDWASKYRVSYVGTTPGSVYTTYTIVGFLIAAGVVFLMLFFNTRIIDKGDIEAITKIPIIGVIGHSTKGSNNVVVDNPKSIISEAFRSIRTNISYLTAGNEKVVVVITSSVSGEGKTFCAINLASIYALAGKKTLLIGADLRKPKIHMDFGLNNSIGMSTYLIKKASFDEVVQQTNLEKLDVIISGPIPPNPAELLGSPVAEELINTAKNRYDVVIIDTAPVGLVTDSLLLTSYADVNLYVVRQSYTKQKQLHAINQHFVENRTKNLGIIVNDLKQERMGYGRYGYGYGYGYGGTYGYGYGYYSDDESTAKKGFSLKSLFGIKS